MRVVNKFNEPINVVSCENVFSFFPFCCEKTSDFERGKKTIDLQHNLSSLAYFIF